jgi:hypothetical protein
VVDNLITRREFVRVSAVAGAGLALAGTKVFGQGNSSGADKPMEIALIGFGAQGRVLLESLLKINGIKLVAVVDIWDYARTYAERYLKASGVEVRTYENY